MLASSSRRSKVFISYSHRDQKYLDRLLVHLEFYRRENLLDIWEDRRIPIGAVWHEEIRQAIANAKVAILLVSADFLASKFIAENELPPLLAAAQTEGATILSVILSPCAFQKTTLAQFQAVNSPSDPLNSMSSSQREELYARVAQIITDFVEGIASPSLIDFSIEQGDIASFDADVLALKYAQEFFGTDEIIARLLSRVGVAEESLRPEVGDYRYIDTRNCILARHALFVGVPDIFDFNYQHIQEFAARVLNVLADIAPTTRHLSMTIHGAGFGLDEIEAFLAQFRGYLYAIQREQFPLNLEKITIIDENLERVQRLRQAFEENFSRANFVSRIRDRWGYNLDKRQLNGNFKSNQKSNRVIENLERATEAKAHVFVAMPFKKDMDDVFYYGIQQPVRAAGFICERVDQEAFIGDILEQVKKKIETAIVVIAELSGANPNVYLEVGYAWGKGRPTILLMKDEQELRFDVRGQRCLKYERIRDLEESLKKELNELKSKGFI